MCALPIEIEDGKVLNCHLGWITNKRKGEKVKEERMRRERPQQRCELIIPRQFDTCPYTDPLKWLHVIIIDIIVIHVGKGAMGTQARALKKEAVLLYHFSCNMVYIIVKSDLFTSVVIVIFYRMWMPERYGGYVMVQKIYTSKGVQVV